MTTTDLDAAIVDFNRAIQLNPKDAVAYSNRGNAFYWPSPVRVGPEAVRLATEALGNEGMTGLSSPKRYLWDERPLSQGWRYNGIAGDGITTEPPVSGPVMWQGRRCPQGRKPSG